MKHTKGKWTALPFGLAKEGVTKVFADFGKEGFSFGKYICDTYGNEFSDLKECEANAKLIASAPELLESLIELENIVSLLVDFDGKSVYKDETKKARNTIKKVTQ